MGILDAGSRLMEKIIGAELRDVLRCVLRVNIGSPKMPAMERNNKSQLKESSGTVDV